jgi:hypothetical protein
VVAGYSENFSKGLFLFFFGMSVSNLGESAEARAHHVLQETLPLRDDPVSHLVLLTTGTYIAKASSNDST